MPYRATIDSISVHAICATNKLQILCSFTIDLPSSSSREITELRIYIYNNNQSIQARKYFSFEGHKKLHFLKISKSFLFYK